MHYLKEKRFGRETMKTLTLLSLLLFTTTAFTAQIKVEEIPFTISTKKLLANLKPSGINSVVDMNQFLPSASEVVKRLKSKEESIKITGIKFKKLVLMQPIFQNLKGYCSFDFLNTNKMTVGFNHITKIMYSEQQYQEKTSACTKRVLNKKPNQFMGKNKFIIEVTYEVPEKGEINNELPTYERIDGSVGIIPN